MQSRTQSQNTTNTESYFQKHSCQMGNLKQTSICESLLSMSRDKARHGI